MRFVFTLHCKANDGTRQVGNNILFFAFGQTALSCILCSGPETGFTKLISLTTAGTLLDL